MRTRFCRVICSTVSLLSLVVTLAGCAQRMQSVKDDGMADAAGLAVLQDIGVSGDGSLVTITSSKPLTYTYYKNPSPLKLVVDISQAEPGSLTSPIEPGKGNIKRIEVTRQGFGQNVLTRVELSLVNDSEATVSTDQENKGKLLIAFSGSSQEQADQKPRVPSEEKAVSAENKTPAVPTEAAKGENPAVSAVSEPKAEAVQPKADDAKGGNGDEKQAAPPVKEETRPPVSPGEKKMMSVGAVGDGIEIAVPGGVDSFHAFKLTQPARLVVDIPGVKNGIGAKAVEIRKFGFNKARIGVSPDKVRVVFDVIRGSLPPYRVEKSDTGLKVVLSGVSRDEPARASGEPAGEPARIKGEEPPPVKQKFSAVEDIGFKSEEGYSVITVKAGGACVAEKPTKSANRWGLTLKNCQLPLNLQRTLDTSAFVSPVQEITPYQVRVRGGYETRLLVKARSDAPFNFRQEGDTIYWSFKNPEPEEKPAAQPEPSVKPAAPAVAAVRKGKALRPSDRELPVEDQAVPLAAPEKNKGYTGRKVTLEFSDADIRKIFQLIAEVSGYNFLISDDVSGTISLKLVNVPWDQALEVILDSKGLDMKREGNIVQIKPKGKFKTQEQEEEQYKRDHEKRLPLVTKVFDINFAALADIVAKFEKLSSKPLGTEASITSDARTNRVIVVDNEGRIKKMEELLAKLDTPEKQVMIEARIVEATSTFTRDIGVQWAMHYKDGSASILGINQLDSSFGGVLSGVAPTTGFQDSNLAGGSMGMSFGKLTSNVQVDMRLAAAATAGLVKIISTPKVVTLNNKAAKIEQGQSIPYQTSSANTGPVTNFVEAALTLEVTPHITSDGNISMKITASNDSPGAVPQGATAPSINTKKATTELLVMNGETTVIGGIYVDNDSESDTGVPFLMDIPLLGWMFKSHNKSKTKTELLIFITPRVVS